MVKVGVHVSIAGSLDLAVDRAKDAGCDVFQMFSRNPRGWVSKSLADDDVEMFRAKIKTTGIIPVDHMPYLPNLASPKPEIYEKSVVTLIAELDRCDQLGIPYLVTHLGHHLGEGIAGGRARVIMAINNAVRESSSSVMLLLENTAGEKNSVGSSFEHIGAILDELQVPGRVGVCFDTCHAFAAGYELRTDEGLKDTLAQFNDQIGLHHLRIIHLNDTKGDRAPVWTGTNILAWVLLVKKDSDGSSTIIRSCHFRWSARLPSTSGGMIGAISRKCGNWHGIDTSSCSPLNTCSISAHSWVFREVFHF